MTTGIIDTSINLPSVSTTPVFTSFQRFLLIAVTLKVKLQLCKLHFRILPEASMTGGKFAPVSITLAVDSDDNIRVLTS